MVCATPMGRSRLNCPHSPLQEFFVIVSTRWSRSSRLYFSAPAAHQQDRETSGALRAVDDDTFYIAGRRRSRHEYAVRTGGEVDAIVGIVHRFYDCLRIQ